MGCTNKHIPLSTVHEFSVAEIGRLLLGDGIAAKICVTIKEAAKKAQMQWSKRQTGMQAAFIRVEHSPIFFLGRCMFSIHENPTRYKIQNYQLRSNLI